MIDRENKRIINGYGTIVVTSSDARVIISSTKPPKEVGASVSSDFLVLDKLDFKYLTYKEILAVEEQLELVTADNPEVLFFDDWVLDFSNFYQKSVDVYKDSMVRAKLFHLYALAC